LENTIEFNGENVDGFKMQIEDEVIYQNLLPEHEQ